MNIFLTGGTGFIGRHLLPELAAQHQLYVLVRTESRLLSLIASLPAGQQANIRPVIGDLTKPGFGLDQQRHHELLAADLIIHAGGPMDIALSREEAEQSFLHPVKFLVRLAKEIHAAKGLKQFIHVVGFMSPYHEQNALTDLDHLLQQAPPYEQMKFRADSYVRKALHAANIPLSTVNPSVVIGDSRTGMTEQLGGLGILVDAVRRGLMQFVPGGDDHWLPMVHADHVASFIAKLVHAEDVSSDTYYLLDAKQESHSIRSLIRLIAEELRTAPPIGNIPLSVLKTALGLGAGKLIGIPKESMNFLVKSEFPARRNQPSLVRSALPFVVCDLDHRLNHAGQIRQDGFAQRKIGDVIALERGSQGIPVLVLHGTFSGADALLPIGEGLQDRHTYFIDLPGFGRTPWHHQRDVIDGCAERIAAMVMEFGTPVILAGHSFGGLIAAMVMQRLPSLIHRLLLLQPVLHPAERKCRNPRVTALLLKWMRPANLRRELLNNRHFNENGKRMEEYVRHVINDLKSPRIRRTNAAVLSALAQEKSIRLQSHKWDLDKVRILWGEKDEAFHIPEPYAHVATARIPYGHQFPIEQPELTARWMREELNK